MTTNPTSGREHDDEIDEQLRDRYRELLEELRTIIPGVQVLFAFLLTAPFSTRFEELDELGVRVFAVALTAAGLATVVLLTPAAYHRVTPRNDRLHRVRLGIALVVAGMVLLAVAVATALFVVARLIFSTGTPGNTFPPTTIAVSIASVVTGTAVTLWFLLPLLRRRTDPDHEGTADPPKAWMSPRAGTGGEPTPGGTR